MKETQNTEFKESWRDEYIKYVSGFANAQGGTLYVGINDKGTVVGVRDAVRLIKDLPNKISTTTGVAVEVNLLAEGDKEYVSIKIQPSMLPISYHGKYYFRSGSTLQELTGIAAQDFIMKKMGISWDGQIVGDATLNDIDPEAVKYFIESGIDNGRLDPDARKRSVKTTLSNLKLINEEGKLTMAALLLFGKDPQKWCLSSTFRIGLFGDESSDLRSQDIVSGDLIRMADRVIKLLDNKYLVRPIHYNGMRRIEHLEIPEAGLREILYNSIVHKDYRGTDIHLRVYPDRLRLSNEGELPEGYTMDVLYSEHESKPRNKLIAKVFYLAGFIESWGRGFDKIKEAFEAEGLELPVYENSCGCVVATIKREKYSKMMGNNGEETRKTTRESTRESILKLLEDEPNITMKVISEKLGITPKGVEWQITRLKKEGVIARVGGRASGSWKVITRKPTPSREQ